MSKLNLVEDKTRALWWCLGCDQPHQVILKGDAAWGWNGSVDTPTFTPSVLVRWPYKGEQRVCHSFVEDGKMRYLGDCTHTMVNQTVDIPDWFGFARE